MESLELGYLFAAAMLAAFTAGVLVAGWMRQRSDYYRTRDERPEVGSVWRQLDPLNGPTEMMIVAANEGRLVFQDNLGREWEETPEEFERKRHALQRSFCGY